MEQVDPGAATHRDREDADRRHFDRIARAYTRKDLNPASRVARAFRLESTIDVAGLDETFDMLEIGCGAGYSADYLRDRLRRYVGVDHSDGLLEIAESRHTRPGVEFMRDRVHELQFDQQFDCVLLLGVLHHLDDIQAAMRSMIRALRPGGWLVANEPQPSNPVVHAARTIRKRVDRSYADDQVELSPTDLVELFRATGLVDVTTRPQGYLSTPFAEVVLPLPAITRPLAVAAVSFDRVLGLRATAPRLAWNCIAVGRRP